MAEITLKGNPIHTLGKISSFGFACPPWHFGRQVI